MPDVRLTFDGASQEIQEWLEVPRLSRPATGSSIFDLVHPSDQTYLSRFLASGRDQAHLTLRLGRAPNWLCFTVKLVRADAAWEAIGLIAEEASGSEREAADNYGALMQQSSDGLLIHRKGIIVDTNDVLLKALGYERTQLLGQHVVNDIIHPEDAAIIREAQAQLNDTGGTPQSADVRYRHHDGSYRVLEGTGFRIIHGGEPANLVFLRDITDRREMERIVLQTERMASVGTLAAGIAHEINNPLAYVLGNLDVLIADLLDLAGPSPPERLRELIEAAREAREGADRTRRIVRGLKAFSRVDAEERTPLDLRSVAEMAIKLATNELRHKAQLVKRFEDVPLVDADESRILQVIVNLLVNAAQALPDDGSGKQRVELRVGTTSAGQACIEVQDTGPGIREALRERIFDPFFTTKPAGVGTGLGLSICSGIVGNHGGVITFDCPEQGGTIFRVTLPAGGSAAPRATDIPKPAPRSGPRGRVLVIDDDAYVGRVLARILRAQEVIVEEGAAAGLERVERGETFDLILCDIMMPETSGIEFYERLGQINQRLQERIVFMTGNAFGLQARNFLERIPNQSLEKPIDAKMLRAIVRSMLLR